MLLAHNTKASYLDKRTENILPDKSDMTLEVYFIY